jgi:hypothetical protein
MKDVFAKAYVPGKYDALKKQEIVTSTMERGLGKKTETLNSKSTLAVEMLKEPSANYKRSSRKYMNHLQEMYSLDDSCDIDFDEPS